MLSAFILVDPPAPNFDGDRGVVKTLAALVPLVVAGVVADATIVARPHQGFQRLENIAGCATVENANLGVALTTALPKARRETALVLTAGYAPDASFITEIESALDGGSAAALALLAAPETMVERLFPSRAPAVGLVASCRALAAVAAVKHEGVAPLRRALGARAMRARGIVA